MKLSTVEGSLESYMRAHNEMQIKVHQQKHVSTFAFSHLHPLRTSDLPEVLATRVSSLLTRAPLSPLAWRGKSVPCIHICPCSSASNKPSVHEQMRDVESRLQLAEFGKSANENGVVSDASSPEVAQKVSLVSSELRLPPACQHIINDHFESAQPGLRHYGCNRAVCLFCCRAVACMRLL